MTGFKTQGLLFMETVSAVREGEKNWVPGQEMGRKMEVKQQEPTR